MSITRYPKPTDMGTLVRQGQAKARAKGIHIGRLKGTVSRTKARRDWKWAVQLDDLIASDKSLQQARGAVSDEEGVNIRKIERAHR